MIPKVYRFIFTYQDSTIATAWTIARNENNALKKMLLLGEHRPKIKYYTVAQESFIANLLVLLIPAYTYRGGKWSKWRTL